MRLIAFAASNSRTSINKQLVTYAARLLEDGLLDDATPDGPGVEVDVEILDLNDYEMPIYSIDREREDGIPRPAHDFFAKIGGADAVLISFAEHNGFYSVAYKNVFDWMSRIDQRVYQGKPTVLMSTSPGGRGGATVLDTAKRSGQFFGYDVLASLAVPTFHANFDQTAGSISNADIDAELRTALRTLADPQHGLVA